VRTDPKPDDAWWDAKDAEWVHGAKNAQGRLVGEVRYWNADGVLISTADHVDGKPHGIARRYFPDGTIDQDCRYVDGRIDGVRSFLRGTGDVPRALTDAAATVVAYECIYEEGDLVGTTFRDADGREVDQHGRPVRERPPGVPPTAFFLSGQGWFYARHGGEDGSEKLLRREYYEGGALRAESSYVDGSERKYHENGHLLHEGQRSTGDRHDPIGTWRYYDDAGHLRRVSIFENGVEVRRTWHRPESNPRSGAIEGIREVGPWTAAARTIDLGPWLTDAELLAHAVTRDELDDTIPGDRTLVGMLALARRAGIAKDIAILALDTTPAWQVLDDDGRLVPLSKRRGLATTLHALRWGPPDGDTLAAIAASLMAGDRAQAALEVLDAAFLLDDKPSWCTARIAYLRATGATVAETSPLDARAFALLDEIREHPDDNAPRLVFADHVASAFPQHTALIVSQCANADDREVRDDFLATLPGWLTKHYNTPVRGFLEDVRYVEARDFVNADSDLLYRVAPTCRQIELQYASDVIAQLVTLPQLARYTELGFTDTYLELRHVKQLARCKHLDNLEHLGLWNTGLDDEELQAICAGPAYPRLQSLDIGHHRDGMSYGLDGVRAIADAAFAATLRCLVMHNRWLGDDIVDVIARLPALEYLDLEGGSLTDAGARALLALPNAWTTLRLGGNDEIGTSLQEALTARFGDRVRFAR
jgi:hypothetical protein